jgi:uncharacterized membrane protein YfcA
VTAVTATEVRPPTFVVEMEIIGWIMALVIGLTLGLLGGGGSILTVPVLVYLLAMDPIVATGYSLFIVGVSSFFGAFSYWTKKRVDFKVVAVFGSASIAAVYLARRVIVPAIPDEIFQIGDFMLTRNMSIMVLFALLMLGASYSMITGETSSKESQEAIKYNYLGLLLQGAIIGILVGLVGAGGGFLIIPTLVMFTKLPIKTAIGTSLSIIAINSVIGFLGDLQTRTMDWEFLLLFTGLAVVGIFGGPKLATYVPSKKLKPAFGWFVLVMGIYILGKEILF